jgi:hypothetical protein
MKERLKSSFAAAVFASYTDARSASSVRKRRQGKFYTETAVA